MASEKIGDAFVELGVKFAGLEKEFSKLDGKLTKQAKKTESAFTGTFKNIAKLAAGAFATQKIISFTKEALTLAGELEGVEAAFGKLNKPDLLDKLKIATRGTITELELMKRAVQANNFKVPLNKLATFFEFATKRSSETGESVDFLVKSIVDGIGRKSSLVLDNLGISATELQAEIGRVGDFGKAAGNIIERELGKMGDVILTSSQKTQQLNAALEETTALIGQKLTPAANATKEAWLNALGTVNVLLDDNLSASQKLVIAFADQKTQAFLLKDAYKELNAEEAARARQADATASKQEALNAAVKLGLIDIKDSTISYNKLTDQQFEVLKNSKDLIKRFLEEASGAKSAAGSVKDLTEQMKALQENQSLSKNTEQWKDIQVEIDAVKEKIAAITGVETEATKALREYRTALGEVKSQMDEINAELLQTIIGSDINIVQDFIKVNESLFEVVEDVGDQLDILEEAQPFNRSIEEAELFLEKLRSVGALANTISGAFESIGNAILVRGEISSNTAQRMVEDEERINESLKQGSITLDEANQARADNEAKREEEAKQRRERALNEVKSQIVKLIAQQLAAATANAITGATGAAAVAGPLAPAVLPATIATMVGTVIAAFVSIPAFARGGQAPGGTSIVGERGPELIDLPRNTNITPNHQIGRDGISASMAQDINVHGVLRGDNIFLSNKRSSATRLRTNG